MVFEFSVPQIGELDAESASDEQEREIDALSGREADHTRILQERQCGRASGCYSVRRTPEFRRGSDDLQREFHLMDGFAFHGEIDVQRGFGGISRARRQGKHDRCEQAAIAKSRRAVLAANNCDFAARGHMQSDVKVGAPRLLNGRALGNWRANLREEFRGGILGTRRCVPGLQHRGHAHAAEQSETSLRHPPNVARWTIARPPSSPCEHHAGSLHRWPDLSAHVGRSFWPELLAGIGRG